MRVIYKYALDRIPKHEAQELFKSYTIFEKKFGDRRGIEDIIVSKRRFQYEEEVKVGVGERLALQATERAAWPGWAQSRRGCQPGLAGAVCRSLAAPSSKVLEKALPPMCAC